jgi:hypothetical protein
MSTVVGKVMAYDQRTLAELEDWLGHDDGSRENSSNPIIARFTVDR